MKNLGYLYHRAKTAIHAPHYQPFLETQDQERILLTQQKKSVHDFLVLLRQIALKVIQKLQQSHYFWGEPKWERAFKLYETQLQDTSLSIYQLCIVLCNVDDLIEVASVLQAVRKDIWSAAKRQAIPSEELEQKYRVAQIQYLEHRDVLVVLDNQVRHIEHTYSEITGHYHSTHHSQGLVITQSVPRELPNYHQTVLQTRFSENHTKHLIQVEGSARLVYQDLAREMTKPSIAEKLSDEIQSGQQRLKMKAETILKTAEDLNHKIQRDSCKLIEHRTQTLLAHANRLEQLALTLEKIMQVINDYLAHHPPAQKQGSEKQTQSLVLIVAEAKLIQDHLQQPFTVVNAQQVQHQILMMEQHRKEYAKTLTGWSSFFRRGSPNHHQHKTIHQKIQNHLAELVVPACGLQDRQGIATAEQIKKQQTVGQQLAHQTHQIHAETKKIQELSHDFSTHCQL
jgi:hypothetical protein